MLILTPINGSQKGKSFDLPADQPTLLGRKAGPIPFDDLRVSGKHAEIYCRLGRWYILDHHSRTGTRVNREKISQPTELSNGDTIQIGKCLLVVTIPTTAQAMASGAPVLPTIDAEKLAEQCVAAVREALAAQDRQKHEAPRPAADEHQALLKTIVARLEAQEQRQQELLQAIAAAKEIDKASGQDVSPLLRDLAAQVEAQQRRTDELLQAVRDGQTTTTGAGDAAASALAAQLQEIRQALTATEPVEPLFRAIVATLESQQRGQNELFASLRQAIDAQPQQVSPALDRLADELHAQQERQEALLAAMRDGMRAVPEQLHAALGAFTDQLEDHASKNEGLLTALREAAVSQMSRVGPAIEAIRQQMTAQEERAAALISSMRDAITDSSKAQEPTLARLSSQIDALLTEHQRSSASIGEVVAAGFKSLQRRDDQTAATLGTVLEAHAEQSAARQAEGVEALRTALAQIAEQQAQQHERAIESLKQAVVMGFASQHQEHEKTLAAVRDALAQHVQVQAQRDEQVVATVRGSITEGFTAQAQQLEQSSASLRDMLAQQAQSASEAMSRHDEQVVAAVRESIDQGFAAQSHRQDQTIAAIRGAIEEQTQQLAQRDEQIVSSVRQVVTQGFDSQRQRHQELMQEVRQAIIAEVQKTPPMIRELAEQAQEQQRQDRESAAQNVRETIVTHLDLHASMHKRLSAQVRDELVAGFARTEPVLRHIASQLETNVPAPREPAPDVLKFPAPADAPARQPETFTTGPSMQPVLIQIAAGTASGGDHTAVVSGESSARSQRRHAWPVIGAAASIVAAAAVALAVSMIEHRRHPEAQPTRVAETQGATTPAPSSATSMAAAPEQEPAATAPRKDSLFTSLFSDNPIEVATSAAVAPAKTPVAPLAPPPHEAPATPEVPKLTRQQESYKFAFENNIPVIIGGTIDPLTGKKAGGKLLDPAEARKLGIKRWEDWYNLQGLIERTELLKQAEQVRNGEDLPPAVSEPTPTPPAAAAPPLDITHVAAPKPPNAMPLPDAVLP